ncbi:hypothetical protein [Mycolicibacterium llatzerense]|uniref:hypothetical protein n=1 Tax=Mycolicibacterium llatzerense TaxID=280871 RepID=UPI0021B5CB70|nr:hypothetical protein [Mycolicibacterium llatzerense]MCT7372668.1 hypothetical protein [Mycolicibacterium llatzerense]
MTTDQSELQQQLAQVRDKLTKQRQTRDKAAELYASTPDGAAETYRRYEMASGAEKQRLRNTYLTGLQLAAEEYALRVELGNARPGDGPLQIIAAGDLDDPIARTLIEHRVMGTLRNGPDVASTETVRIALFRLAPNGRDRPRLAITAPAPFGIFTATLAEIITTTSADTKYAGRLRKFLGPIHERLTL